MKYILFLLPMSAWCVTIPIKILGTTPTQVTASYTATTAGACTVAVSEGTSIGTLVYDVDPALFSGSDSDERTGDVFSGTSRKIVVGQRKYQFASDGLSYSRALQNNTQHLLQVTCGSDTGTASFTTVDPKLGAAPDIPPFDSSAFGNYGQPTIDFHINTSGSQDKTYVDALTGMLMRRGTSPYDNLDVSATNIAFSSVSDPTSAWTTPNNIIGNSGVATYAGSATTAAYLYLQAARPLQGASLYAAEEAYVDMALHMVGTATSTSSGNNVLQACITQDHGQTCQGKVVDLPGFPTTPATLEYYPSNYPSLIFKEWTAANGIPISTTNIFTRTGNVTVTGNVVVLNSGNSFVDLVAGDVITIPGSGCPNSDTCVFSSITNAGSGVIGTTLGSPLTANYTANNFGWKLWKKTATGSISVNTAQFDAAHNEILQMPVSGAYSQCSRLNAPTTVDRSGTPLGFTQNGNLCVQTDIFSNSHLWWNGTNGEVRFISGLVRPAVASPAADIVATGFLCQVFGGASQLSPWSQSDANTLYCSGTKTGSPPVSEVIYSCVYNPSDVTWGNYVEFTDFTASLSNPAMVCSNITKASDGIDMNTQGVPLGYDIASGTTFGPYFSFAPLVAQNGLCYYARFNINTKILEFLHDSWTTYPRWSGCHGTAGIGYGYGGFFVAPLRQADALGEGKFNTVITAIAGLGNTHLTDTYVDASTCEALGVTNTTYIAQGATGLNCIAVTTTGEPYNPTPNTVDVIAHPWPHNNNTTCPGPGDNTTVNCWSYLGPAIEGDFILDDAKSDFSEQFRLVKKFSATSWILQRNASQADCSTPGKVDHADGWFPIMFPDGMCTAVSYYFDTATNAVSHDLASMNSGHNDLLTDNVTNFGYFVQSGYNIRVGPLTTNIGQPATYNSLGEFEPTFNGSAAAVEIGDVQSHPSGRQLNAPPNEFRWLFDGRPYGGAQGGATGLFYHGISTTTQTGVYKVGMPTSSSTADQTTATASSGAFSIVVADATGIVDPSVAIQTVQGPGIQIGTLVTSVSGTTIGLSLATTAVLSSTPVIVSYGHIVSYLDRKNLPNQVWAGRYLLQDKSGPGSTLLTADTWKFCVADFAGECFVNSAAGDVYMNVPQLYNTADGFGLCNAQMEQNTPCFVSANPQSPFITQFGVDKPDTAGTYWRRMPNFFNGIGWTDNFWNARSLPDASWMFSNGKWLNGVSTQIIMAKLPPWPAQDTIQRNTFVPIVIQLHTASAKVFKARFGYDTNLYCTSRLEQCATMGTPTGSSPFQWVSEAMTGTSINGSGSVTIPAISGRVLYYVLDNVTDGTSGPMQVVPVP